MADGLGVSRNLLYEFEQFICKAFNSTLAILSRQGGEMSLTIDELSQSSCYRRRTSHAAPARRHHTGLGPFCTTVFPASLAPCAALAPGRDAGSTGTHGDRCLAGDGIGAG